MVKRNSTVECAYARATVSSCRPSDVKITLLPTTGRWGGRPSLQSLSVKPEEQRRKRVKVGKSDTNTKNTHVHEFYKFQRAQALLQERVFKAKLCIVRRCASLRLLCVFGCVSVQLKRDERWEGRSEKVCRSEIVRFPYELDTSIAPFEGKVQRCLSGECGIGFQ
jgi:hypothetical protein